jgi:hypothetical protein
MEPVPKTPELTMNKLNTFAEQNKADEIRYILSNTKLLNKLSLGEVVSTAITHFAQESLLVLLEFTTREEIVGSTPLVLSVQVGNVAAFETLSMYFPLEESEVSIAADLLANISESHSPYELLKVFVDNYKSFDTEFGLGSYCDSKRKYEVSEEEIILVLDHPRLFDTSEVNNVRNLSPKAAYLLYFTTTSTEYKSRLLSAIVTIPELVLQALDYAVPDDVTEALYFSFINNEDSAIVILEKSNPTKEEVYKAVFAVIVYPFLVDCVRYACNKVDISQNDIEVMVMEQTNRSVEGSVNSLMELGVKLSRSKNSRALVGEKIAFNCEQGVWKELYASGFDFDYCGTDLLIHIVSTSVDRFEVEELLKYVTKYDKNIPYYRYSSSPDVRNYMFALSRGKDSENTSKFVMHMRDNEIDDVYNYLRKGIVWKNIVNYDWLDNVTPELAKDPFMQEGLYFIWGALENRILRCIDVPPGQLITNLRHWLMLSTGFKQPITVLEDEVSTFVKIGNIEVNIKTRITTSGKYKGLDLFSTEGQPLTTRQQIVDRRKELHKRY